ncbi:anticodon-binding aminoacyl-tRNA synthetase, class 1a [Tanacetum coccineum]
MGDENPIRTLGDYSKPSHEGYRNTIELPVGNNMVPLRSDTIRLVQNECSFHGLWSEDPNQHLKDFLKLVDLFDIDEDLALFDNESWNNPRDFAKPVKAITLPQDVLSTSYRHLIELENQVQRLMESHLAPTQPTQVNKITTSYEICSGPHDTQIYMENPKQAFFEYASSRTDEAGVPRSSNTKFVCSKEDDGEVMFIEIIRDDDEPQNEREVAPTEEPITHSYQKSLHRPQLPVSSTSPVVQIVAKLYVTTDKVRDIETSAHIDVHDDDYVINDATVALYRENAKKNLDVFDLFNNISTSEIEAAAREKPDIDINNEAFEVCNDCLFLNFSNKPNGGSDHITIRGKDGSLAMFYLALKNAVDADLKVEFLVPSMETKVYGSVVAYFGKNFEYSDSDDLYYLILFKKKRSAFVGPGSLHLMRSALAVPANSSLIIKANLFDNTSENEILSGTCEITVGLDGKPTVGSIVSKDYSLSVLVNWKLPSEELKIPSSPICPPALASNSIVSRLTKRIKFGAHSTSSMAGHSTFSMTDPDERNRWSLQEELENVFNASLKRVFNLQEVVSWSISTCTKEDGGDYLCSGVMHIWPELRKARSYRGPKRAGLALKNIMESEYNDMMESCVVCSPGYVKFKLSSKWIAEGIHRILTASIDTWAPKLTVKKTVIYCFS